MNTKLFGLCAFLIFISACVGTPSQPKVDNVVWLNQGWTDEQRQKYHHESQGTATIPIPYEWFIALEQPLNKLNWFKGSEKDKFSSTSYLSKFGYIPSKKTDLNPDNLPVGFAKTTGMPDLINGGTYNAIGLTCAGCHTGQMSYQGTSIRIDGAPAVSDITSMIGAVGVAIIETAADPLRLIRFKHEVLKEMQSVYPTVSKAELDKRFSKTFKETLKLFAEEVIITAKNKKKSVEEGFTRLDALNRIGNTVFGAYKKKNIAPTNAPVSYPYIWTVSWFNWVQYDASIMSPMIRNAGESMGVAAWLNLEPGPTQFDSSVAIEKIFGIETLLAGDHPQKRKAFNGLASPKWPEETLGTIDHNKATKGKLLYGKYCESCHLPVISDARFWTDKYWKKISPNGEKFLSLNLIPISEIGTDSAQANILATRTVDISGMDMNGTVCNVPNGKPVQVTSGAQTSFAFALGLTVEQVVKYYYAKHNIDPAKQVIMNGGRPNCLQAPMAYKARPLNGVWATAPFLHNGSVSSLYEMLKPAGERASTLYLGYQEFDPIKVGYISTMKDGLKTTKSLTKVIVSGSEARLGNFNSGHEFSDNMGGQGVIGPRFKDSERWELVEYLKTL